MTPFIEKLDAIKSIKRAIDPDLRLCERVRIGAEIKRTHKARERLNAHRRIDDADGARAIALQIDPARQAAFLEAERSAIVSPRFDTLDQLIESTEGLDKGARIQRE